MSARVDLDAQTPATIVAPAGFVAAAAIAVDADERFGGHHLPSDHPSWMKDTLSLSQRARSLFAALKPVAIRIATFWDHRVRSLSLASGTLSVDASGSYRLH